MLEMEEECAKLKLEVTRLGEEREIEKTERNRETQEREKESMDREREREREREVSTQATGAREEMCVQTTHARARERGEGAAASQGACHGGVC